MKPKCFGYFGVTDDCFSCLLKDDCEDFVKELCEEYEFQSDIED